MSISEKELLQILMKSRFDRQDLFPEASPEGLRRAVQTPHGRKLLAGLKGELTRVEDLPPVPRSLYEDFFRTGTRKNFEKVIFQRRGSLSRAALCLALLPEPRPETADVLCDWLWNVCEESSWVLPAHAKKDHIELDLTATMTALLLAEILFLVEDQIEPEVSARVRAEIDRRVLTPYLKHGHKQWWYRGGSNWNGVCNGKVGATFLHLETDPKRLARALAKVLRGMEYFFRGAFTNDGASTEGIGYWQYGMSGPVFFSELLRNRTGGEIDLLSTERIRQIATYPSKILLSEGGVFYPYADCSSNSRMSRWLAAILEKRTGVTNLRSLVSQPPIRKTAKRTPNKAAARGAQPVPHALRDLLWWDGRHLSRPKLMDASLPKAGVARLVSNVEGNGNGKQAQAKEPLVLALKAGHNQELHNHNDVGSFVVAKGDEVLICDPGAGVYTRDTFSKKRYEDPFLNSYGHDVPLIGGQQQQAGEQFRGRILKLQSAENGNGHASGNGSDTKQAVMEFAEAYGISELRSLRRTLELPAAGSNGSAPCFRLRDDFKFEGEGMTVEEAFMTKFPVRVRGQTATIRGDTTTMKLTIQTPENAEWSVEKLSRDSHENGKETLNRLRCRLRPEEKVCFEMVGEA